MLKVVKIEEIEVKIHKYSSNNIYLPFEEKQIRP